MQTASAHTPSADTSVELGAVRLPNWAPRAAELAKAGWTRDAIGKEVGVSGTRVSKVLGRMEFPPGQPGQPRKHPKPEPHPCEHCRTVFTPANAANPGRFCSTDCANESRAKYPKPEPRACEICGEKFKPGLRRAGLTARFCSDGCRNAGLAKYPPPEPRKCAHPACDVVFTPEHPSASANGQGLYHSPECANSAPERRAKIRAWLHTPKGRRSMYIRVRRSLDSRGHNGFAFLARHAKELATANGNAVGPKPALSESERQRARALRKKGKTTPNIAGILTRERLDRDPTATRVSQSTVWREVRDVVPEKKLIQDLGD